MFDQILSKIICENEWLVRNKIFNFQSILDQSLHFTKLVHYIFLCDAIVMIRSININSFVIVFHAY